MADQLPDWRHVLRGSRVQGQGPTNEPDHNPSGNGVFDAADTVNPKIFARILFSRMALKDIFATFKIRD